LIAIVPDGKPTAISAHTTDQIEDFVREHDVLKRKSNLTKAGEWANRADEELRDSLNRLVEKTAIDPGAPFAPDVLERLAALKRDDRGAFESLRARLKSMSSKLRAELSQWAGDLDALMNGRQHTSKRWR
jgi:hypothetical protein